nr:MAG TPA: hypothetical protein [Caudoviricetes sp.]
MNISANKSKRPSGPSTGTARPVLMMTGPNERSFVLCLKQ